MSKLKNRIRRFLNYFGIDIVLIHGRLFNPLLGIGVPRKEWIYQNGNYFLKELNLIIYNNSKKDNLWYYYAVRIRKHLNSVFYFEADGELVLKISGIVFQINSPEELYIINEIFVENTYNIEFSREHVVIDVGQNVGIASLYFAAMSNVVRVYGYELFPKTFECGQRNISLNPGIASKILSSPFGLAKENKLVSLNYNSESKGRMGLKGLPDGVLQADCVVDCEVKEACEAIGSVMDQESELPFICKLDCEGAELEIIENLFSGGLLIKMAVLLIEWHDDSYDHIAEILRSAGFSFVGFRFPSLTSGMIYAFNPSIQVK